MQITFARGDSYEKPVILRDRKTKQPITEIYDNVYFTAKKNYNETEYKLQKRMSDGGITYEGDGHYTLIILPEDTDGLPFGDYDCDFEFVKGQYKRTFFGRMTLAKEVTYASNE